ncbi:regulating synaptic membrane exocytosis protein 2-like isoform X3 [Zootermopsis nevadensis]|uniref:regulating synaptic membrane exocytosis protein 2-like isoform X3 n=1 Tax=Zootermopsis nevadensis TaxID=136037 RepID=UPI000B8E2CEF|nr:regulating synaptic membrane exocytosis protein 2-like isoform X3 [Zootermopsis nevadensis]
MVDPFHHESVQLFFLPNAVGSNKRSQDKKIASVQREIILRLTVSFIVGITSVSHCRHYTMADLPDMSHLTAEERRIIESVMMRQKQEEEREHEIMRRKQDEVQVLEDTIRQRSEQQKKAGVELDATCHICLKTKFADGVGHICNYCNIRCCARCGGKVPLRSNKVIWVCILCRKKQELLSKTGQWINKGMAAGDAIMHQIEADLHQRPEDITPTLTTPTDKRPKLERAHSAAEKENVPLVRSGSVLTRQYSQQDQATMSGRRMSASDSGVDVISPSQRHTGRVREPSVDRGQSFQQLYHEDDPRYYRSELEDLMRSQQLQHLHGSGIYGSEIVHRGSGSGGVSAGSGFRNDSLSSEQSSSMDMTSCPPTAAMRGNSGAPMMMVPGGNNKKHRRSGSGKKTHAHHPSSTASQQSQQQLVTSSRHHQQSQHQQSFSSSDDELRSTPECTSCEEHDSDKDIYDSGRRDKPSVLVTSPGSPDFHIPVRSACPPRLGSSPTNSNVGGRLQVKLWFDSVALELVVTVASAAGLTPRNNGQPRNPYAKLFLLPDRSEKSKRRTKTLANTNDPKWNQKFIYSSIRRADLKLRVLEVTVWDYVRYGANDFLGEVVMELSETPLDEEPVWYYLSAHEEILTHSHARHGDVDPTDMELALTPTDHLSPPSTTSRLSDSDTSECDLEDGLSGVGVREHRIADGASISSVGSSSSPPPEVEMQEIRRSRRDMSPQGRKRAAVMMSRDKIVSYQPQRKNGGQGMMGQRSHSAAPTDSPSLHSRSRSKSPRRMGDHRSLSPPEGRMHLHGQSIPSHAYVPRFSRSATATPTGSPKKRQLPQIPHALQKVLKERVTQDLEDRARMMKQRMQMMQGTRSSGMWRCDRNYSGRSDSDLPSRSTMHCADQKIRLPHSLSPDKDVMGDFGDSDIESVVSITSSAFSTQSERPLGSIGLSDYGSSSGGGGGQHMAIHHSGAQGANSSSGSKRNIFTRSLSNADVPPDEKADGSLSDTAVGHHHGMDGSRQKMSGSGERSRKPTGGGGSISGPFIGLGKKSSSTSQLSATGNAWILSLCFSSFLFSFLM